MRWVRRISDWRDAECRSAVILAGVGLMAVVITRCPQPRCLLKTWTGVPCCTCGATRALNALLQGHVAAAFRLQPLLAALALAAVVWIGYAVAGSMFGLPRVRVQAARREKIALLALAVAMAVANWVYLVVDGR